MSESGLIYFNPFGIAGAWVEGALALTHGIDTVIPLRIDVESN